MKLDLNEIATHLGKRIRYEINEPPIEAAESGLKFIAPIKGEVTFTNTGRHIVVRGSITTTIELECVRCLTMFGMDVAPTVNEELAIAVPLAELEVEEDEEQIEDESESLFVDNMLDLTELLRQDILLMVPIKSICSETCKGLCLHCGKNLNEGACDCPVEESTGAFAELAALLDEEEKPEL